MSTDPPQSRTPRWYDEYGASFASGEAHAFILHGDIAGVAYEAVTHRAYLQRALASKREVVAIYHRAGGISFAMDSMRQRAIQLLGLADSQPATDDPMVAALAALGGPAPQTPDPFANTRRPGDALALLERLLRTERGRGKIAVIIDYADTLFPPATKDMLSPDDRTLLVTALSWGQDARLGRQDNPVFLLTGQLAEIHPDLRSSGSGYKALDVSLPDRVARFEYIRWYLDQRQKRNKPPIEMQDLSIDEMANTTAGLNLKHLEDILLRAAKEGGVTRALVKGRKDTIVASEYTEVAELIEPLRGGFEAIGGMDYLKNWARGEIIAPVRDGRLADAPKGVLLVGPPGTGKTWFVRGLAAELGFNAVALRAENILGGIVGESERKLSRFFAFCRALSPVLVFFDELDQSDMAQRGNTSGNPVASNLFSQMLQFMSDETLRGRVIVVFASNRPDLIDPALMRFGRMDAIIPVLLPDADERRAIIQAQATAQNVGIGQAALALIAQETNQYSAGDLGAVVAKARKLANRAGQASIGTEDATQALRWVRPATIRRATYYTLLAIQACNDGEHLPPAYADLLIDRATLNAQLQAAQRDTLPEQRSERDW